MERSLPGWTSEGRVFISRGIARLDQIQMLQGAMNGTVGHFRRMRIGHGCHIPLSRRYRLAKRMYSVVPHAVADLVIAAAADAQRKKPASSHETTRTRSERSGEKPPPEPAFEKARARWHCFPDRQKIKGSPWELKEMQVEQDNRAGPASAPETLAMRSSLSLRHHGRDGSPRLRLRSPSRLPLEKASALVTGTKTDLPAFSGGILPSANSASTRRMACEPQTSLP